MSLFDDVKANITAKEAAEGYGIKVSKKGMACCPFHDDKTPSMSIKENFHCFGCQESGDVYIPFLPITPLPPGERIPRTQNRCPVHCERISSRRAS